MAIYIICLLIKLKFRNKILYENKMGIGDWGLGIGPNPQTPKPKPQHKSLLQL
jgi:hypothetical protein